MPQQRGVLLAGITQSLLVHCAEPNRNRIFELEVELGVLDWPTVPEE